MPWVNASALDHLHPSTMSQPRPPYSGLGSPAVEVDVKAVRDEAIRAVRVIQDRLKPDDIGKACKSNARDRLASGPR